MVAKIVMQEGYNEEAIVVPNLQKERYTLIRSLREYAITVPEEKSIGEYEGLAFRKLKEFESLIIDSYSKDKLIVSNGGERKIWTFFNAVVYCSTIYTSIGYGHIYPTTMTGRALTIVYSLIGIPIFLLALTDFGKLFTRCIKFLWSFVRRLYYTGSCRNVRKQAQVQEIFKGAQMMYDIATFRRPSAVWDPEDPTAVETPQETPTTPAISNFEIDDEFNLPISVAIFILLMYIFFGAFFYGYMEGWNFFQSFYFVFISMSTIGFGDLVPNNPLCTIISIVYLVFGLALMSMCINVVQEKMSDTFKSASAKIGASLGVTVAAEDGSIITVPRDTIEMPPVHDYTAVEKSYDGINEEEKTNKISFEEEKR
ncbi:potassium channel subfamily K member 1 isoform X3 [Coccinella septempunctata]|uniref:potassium channel subfamily K member 1 isoform X3 n=1 Tax=Coccinella septempunctata TaxID=41139 RepID=UPI001D06CA00|nr:potassium channel subfamily K member 1 isoform X3 [Coccinella septempunctata]